jgi:tetratricopeptide (TPR) repeat protein
MKSMNLDETSPTHENNEDLNPAENTDGLSIDRREGEGANGRDATQPAPVAPLKPVSEEETAEPSISETQPSRLDDEGIYLPPVIPEEPPEAPRGRHRWILWAFIAVLLLALIAGGSAYTGYASAIDQRNQNQATQFAGEAANQYTLAQQDIAAGNYDRARQRLEYVITLVPDYPNAEEALADVLTQQRITATPTLAPTPTLTPTPDYRGRDDLYTQAQSQLLARDWSGTIDTLLLLRKNYPDYMAVTVDGMLFVALRNRGVDKIAQLHDLEGGNYDLTLAERFGPLDAEARNWRDWADIYIRGASFWDVDWAQAVYYFSQLANAAPNLSDSSGWTASNRYLDALLGYGDWFAANSQWCDAQAQYDTYMSLLANPQVEPTAVYASDKCTQSKNPPPPPATPVTETPTPTSTQEPAATPYP